MRNLLKNPAFLPVVVILAVAVLVVLGIQISSLTKSSRTSYSSLAQRYANVRAPSGSSRTSTPPSRPAKSGVSPTPSHAPTSSSAQPAPPTAPTPTPASVSGKKTGEKSPSEKVEGKGAPQPSKAGPKGVSSQPGSAPGVKGEEKEGEEGNKSKRFKREFYLKDVTKEPPEVKPTGNKYKDAAARLKVMDIRVELLNERYKWAEEKLSPIRPGYGKFDVFELPEQVPPELVPEQFRALPGQVNTALLSMVAESVAASLPLRLVGLIEYNGEMLAILAMDIPVGVDPTTGAPITVTQYFYAREGMTFGPQAVPSQFYNQRDVLLMIFQVTKVTRQRVEIEITVYSAKDPTKYATSTKAFNISPTGEMTESHQF